MVEMHANDRTLIDSAQAGDIVALVGLKNVQTGHTLCDEDNPATLEPMVFPAPVISIAGRAEGQGQRREARHRASARWSRKTRRSTSRSTRSPARRSSRAWASCTSTSRSTSCAAPTAWRSPSASRRSPTARPSPSRSTTATPTRSRPAVPASTRRSSTRIEPGEPGAGFVFESDIVGGSDPEGVHPRRREGLQDSRSMKGPLAGYPVLRLQGHAHRRRLPRRGLVADRVRSRRQGRLPPDACPRPARSSSSRS